jgi:probable HAF family extracellular repeat protein
MKKKILKLSIIGSMIILIISCKKGIDGPPVEIQSASAENSKQFSAAENSLPEANFSRGFGINNSGAITGAVRNTDGQIVAFVLKNNKTWFSNEEVSSNGLPEIRFSINDPGDVAGHRIVPGGIIPMLWKKGQAYDLQPLPGQQYGEVYDINNAGQMVGESLNGNFITPTTMRATLFSLDGNPVDLGTLGGAKASAAGINEDGDIVGFSDLASGQSHAFLYKDGVMHDLGTLGGTISNANAINNNGEIAGRSTLANGAIRGFLYKDGVMHDLGTLGGAASVAFDINDKGEIVGFSRISNGQARAFLYKDGMMHDLGALGGTDSRAISINNKGEIIGHYTKPDGSVHGFIYREGQMFPL